VVFALLTLFFQTLDEKKAKKLEKNEVRVSDEIERSHTYESDGAKNSAALQQIDATPVLRTA